MTSRNSTRRRRTSLAATTSTLPAAVDQHISATIPHRTGDTAAVIDRRGLARGGSRHGGSDTATEFFETAQETGLVPEAADVELFFLVVAVTAVAGCTAAISPAGRRGEGGVGRGRW